MAASGSLVDFGLYFFHNAQRLIASGRGPYFYLAKLESSEEAKLWDDVFTFSERVHRHPARHDPRDRAHRDAAGRIRDGGDPVRAARPLRGPERRALGLHLLDHQELPRPRGALRAPRPQRGHDDRAVHAGIHRAARQDVPQARSVRDRRHERVHPEPPRPGGDAARVREGRRRQEARSRRRVRRHVGGAPRPDPDGDGGVRRGARRAAQPGRPSARRRRGDRRPSCSTCTSAGR